MYILQYVCSFQVKKYGEATTLIEIFFEETNDFVCFHETCSLTQIQLELCMGLPNESVFDELNKEQEPAAQTTEIKMSSPTSRPSNAKRRNTFMDSNDLVT